MDFPIVCKGCRYTPYYGIRRCIGCTRYNGHVDRYESKLKVRKMQDPTNYNKTYFMASAVFWYLTATFTDGYNDEDVELAMEDVGIPDKYLKKVRRLIEYEDFIT